MQKPALVNLLEDATKAHTAGDFNSALEFYEAFFDQAAEQDPEAYYAMRLSHCLQGWAELAEQFPGALNRLNAKRLEVLANYRQQQHPERFHDYFQICRVLGREDEALQTFLELHAKEPDGAKGIAKFVWDDLVANEYWTVCSELLEQPNHKLDELFAIYNEALKLKAIDPTFNTPRFESHVVEQLLVGVERVVGILRHAGRTEEIEQLQIQFHVAMQKIKDHILNKQVQARGAYLFSGH